MPLLSYFWIFVCEVHGDSRTAEDIIIIMSLLLYVTQYQKVNKRIAAYLN